ncbi:Uu.00g038870.m01.CDS01 [Anthostomella pinea]|uniref:Uu.00g038870.m01.CDS01 n=1 Tax=Anthostomella pinea TaxID=933095 RepID=A0AAI8V9W1_9PEZI|nr:Uu.00g038870.m01.CDS01 [Anthostomella pinea]
MPPHLDLPRSTHAKMIASRPQLNLRRAASYQGDRGAKSSTSSRFNFNHLIFSPPPSPGLPALVPRPRKSPTTPRPSRVLRVVAWISGLALFLIVATSFVRRDGQVPVVGWALKDGREEYEMIGQYDLPEFPTPIAVTDRHGRSKWTVSIPPTYAFPLTVAEYSDICAKCQEVAAHVRELHGSSHPSQQASPDYYYEDPYFVDVGEAQKRGLLPGVEGKAWKVTAQAQDGHLVGEQKDGLVDKGTCKTSLTFVLESPDAGLGPTLMMLWMAYGLAQKEKRSFFIDDSRWAYGDYTTIFKAPTAPSCKPPPRHEMLPCPHNARHLVVSPATARESFGTSFSAEYENLKRDDINRERPMYDLARAGYEALFHLNDDDQPYVETRVKELRAKAKAPQGGYGDGTIVGVHIRHGDLHPYEYQYNGAYVPLELYRQKARDIIDDRHNFSTLLGGEDVAAKRRSFVVLASDDPDVYETDEFSSSVRAQEQIKLASKQHIQDANPDGSVMHKFVDETFGWEGGFFASMFWNLGRSTLNNGNAAEGDLQTSLEPSAETMRLRGLIGRAYILDLAVLGQASDAVICTMSAGGCRLLAVIMGWEKAMDNANWVNIDGDFRWTGLSL